MYVNAFTTFYYNLRAFYAEKCQVFSATITVSPNINMLQLMNSFTSCSFCLFFSHLFICRSQSSNWEIVKCIFDEKETDFTSYYLLLLQRRSKISIDSRRDSNSNADAQYSTLHIFLGHANRAEGRTESCRLGHCM